MFNEGDKVRVKEFEAYISTGFSHADGTLELSFAPDRTDGIYVPEKHLELVEELVTNGLYLEPDSGNVYQYTNGYFYKPGGSCYGWDRSDLGTLVRLVPER